MVSSGTRRSASVAAARSRSVGNRSRARATSSSRVAEVAVSVSAMLSASLRAVWASAAWVSVHLPGVDIPRAGELIGDLGNAPRAADALAKHDDLHHLV